MDKRKSKTSVDMAPLLRRCHTQHEGNSRENIYQFWISRDLTKFTKALGGKHVDLGHSYEEHDGCNIMDIIAQKTEGEEYMKAIIKTGYNVNTINPVTGKVAAHNAAEHGNDAALRVLLDSGADMNIQDSNGDTPLHILVAKWDSSKPGFDSSLQLLLGSWGVSVNVPNKKGHTPISLAASASEAEIIAEFLRLGAALDLDTFRCIDDNKTSREIILKNFPGLEDELPEGVWQPDEAKGTLDYKFRLFYFLKHGQEIKFCQTFRDIKDKGDLLTCYDEQRYTYLQHACEKGCQKAARTLIKAGADVNLALMGTPSPILLATQSGRCDVVNLLLGAKEINLTPDSSGETLLHAVVRGQGKTYSHFLILRRVIHHPMIDINAKDTKGRTALHFAAAFSDEKTIFFLLDNGAKLDLPNTFGETPIDLISADTLRRYLDSKISNNNELPKHCDFSYVFDYKFIHSKRENHIYGACTVLLSKIADNRELRGLLSHPIYATIILFKWQRVRMFFYLDLFFYTLFCLTLTAYIFLGPMECNLNNAFESNSTNLTDFNSTEVSNLLNTDQGRYILVVELFLLLFAIVLGISEMFQFLGTPAQYFFFIENWLQIGIVVLSVISVTLGCPSCPNAYKHCNEINAYAIFFVWFEFFFVVGKHPKLTFYVDMFRTAALFLLKFLIVHTSLILAFALSFYVLFRDFVGPFQSVKTSVFKTIVMITGEYDVGEIPLDSVPVSSHVLFGIFLFLVAIVLFNLLIGLAVSATRPIEDDAFLYSCIAQVPIISFFEDIFFNESHFCKRLFSKILSCGRQKKKVSDLIPTLHIFPNQKNRIEVRCMSDDSTDERIIPIRHHLTDKIVSDTQYIITSKQDAKSTKCSQFDDIKNQVEAVQSALEDELKTLKTGLLEILEKLEGQSTDDLDGQAKKKKRAKADVVLKKLRSYGMKREQRQHKFSKQEEESLKCLM